MKNSLSAWAFVGLAGLWALPLYAQNDLPKKVPSLSHVRSTIDSARGKAIFDQEMAGATRPNGFGSDLPTGMTSTDIVRLVLPNDHAELATLVGIKRWPQQAGRYIAFVCLAPTAAAKQSALQYNHGQPLCSPWQETLESKPSGSYRMAVAVLQLNAEMRLELVSHAISWSGVERSPLGARWTYSSLFGPLGINDGDAPESATLKAQWFFPTDLYALDLANYAIAEGTTAFGIRSGLSESYSGGGANFQILTLFAIINGELRMIFSEPMYAFKDLAGDWNKNGSRQHHVYEAENSVRIAQTAHHGYFDLVVQSKQKGWRQVFQWDPNARRYLAANSNH